jgi:hypothetical protein
MTAPALHLALYVAFLGWLATQLQAAIDLEHAITPSLQEGP